MPTSGKDASAKQLLEPVGRYDNGVVVKGNDVVRTRVIDATIDDFGVVEWAGTRNNRVLSVIEIVERLLFHRGRCPR